MSNNYYEIYIKQCRDLVESLVIKSEYTAEGLNRRITDNSPNAYIDEHDKRGWKYYMNLAGQYHYTDPPIYVVSVDTLETILFSLEKLKLHKATARAYAFGTDKYYDLIDTYPNQELLITGILNPIDIDRAINADDHSIIGYSENLVEINEYNLIGKIQAWVNQYFNRWVNVNYTLIAELYMPLAIGILYANLRTVVLNARLANCHTNQAHSFHVQQYLVSHGFVARHLNRMTLKQRLYMYRNINVILRNQGQQKTFDRVKDILLTERNVPLAEYLMRHDVTDMPKSLFPTVLFKKNPLNLQTNTSPNTTVTVTGMLLKEDPVAIGNPAVRDDDIPVVSSLMKKSMSSVVLTKTLESSVIDETNSSTQKLTDTLLNHWIDWTNLGLYRAHITVPHPATGDTISLSPEEALVLMHHCFCKAANINLPVIPRLTATRVQRLTGYDQRSA